MSRADAKRQAEEQKRRDDERSSDIERARVPKDRTQVDIINDRLRAKAFDQLEAQIRALPKDQQDIFRSIQRLLPEKN